jgi:hypothetical protein
MAKKAEELVTQSEAAARLDIPLARLNQWVRRERVRVVEQYGRRLVYLSDVMAYQPEANKGGRPATKKGGKK